MDGFREHAGGPSVHPCQELEEEVEPVAVDRDRTGLKGLNGIVCIALPRGSG